MVLLYLRSLLFYLGMAASTVFFALTGLLTFPFPWDIRYRYIVLWARFNLWWLNKTCGLGFTVEGKEHIPRDRNGVVLCKHQSAWETLALQLVFPPQTWVVKRELLWIPFFGWGLALLYPIAVDQRHPQRALRQLIKQGKRHLEAGRWVIVFPEGTRMPPGQKGKYAIGGALLASVTGYPVVPVAHNAGEFWGPRSFLKYPGTIQVVIGPVIESQGKKAAEINVLAEAWIESTMKRISHGSRRPPYR